MNRQEFNKSWNGNLPEKRPLSMLTVKIQLECSCNRLFFTTLGTTELEGDFIKRCPLCKRTHRFCWFIETMTDEDLAEREEEDEDE